MGSGDKRYGQGSGDLGETAAAEFARHQTAYDDHRGLSDDRKQAQAHHRQTEEAKADVFEKWREGRIGDESPIEVAGVAEELKFIAMKAVAAVGGDVDDMPQRRRCRTKGTD